MRGERGERLGVLGGTFDPVHIGHLVAAMNVRYALGLDRVLLVVAARPWQKGDRRLAPAEDRLAMVEAAVDDVEGLEASRLEMDRDGDTVTADTLEALAAAQTPPPELFLILGADVASQLDTWRRPEAVRALATVVVVDRPGAEPAALPPGWRATYVDIPLLEVSSSEIRWRLAGERPVDFLVPRETLTLIRQRGLYAGSR